MTPTLTTVSEKGVILLNVWRGLNAKFLAPILSGWNIRDIDLLIDFDLGKGSFDNYMAVYDLFEDIFKNEKVELITKNSLSPYIGPKILQEVLYV